MIIGCDFYPRFQQIAYLDQTTGECGRVAHPLVSHKSWVPHPSLFSSEGWEATNLRSPFLSAHHPEPMSVTFEINFLCDAEGACSLPEDRSIPLSNVQLLSKTAAPDQGWSLYGFRARA